MEIWITGVASPRASARTARALEEAGWDGFLVVDSQNLSGDPYVALAMAATTTTRIGLGTGVSNTVTRQAAVTACSIASVDRISGGRAVLGIGRGDSALAHLGRAPSRLAPFGRYLKQVQTYLRGEAVAFEDIDLPATIAPPMSELELADAPPASRIDWIAQGVSHGGRKVPVEVAASGPKVIAIAALHADRVMFALGADPERIAWGIETACKARRDAGLDPDGIAFGAYINIGCHTDIDRARNLVKGGLTTFARFSVMHGKASGPVSETDRAVLHARIARRFDAMLAAGLVDEVRRLKEDYGLDPDLPSMRCVGYRQSWQYLAGRLDREGLRAQGIAATRQLAKRQLTWLRAMENVTTFDCLLPDVDALVLEYVRRELEAMEYQGP